MESRNGLLVVEALCGTLEIKVAFPAAVPSCFFPWLFSCIRYLTVSGCSNMSAFHGRKLICTYIYESSGLDFSASPFPVCEMSYFC